MKAISESQLQNSLDSGSKKRLIGYRKSLSRDSDKVLFDPNPVPILEEFCTDVEHFQQVRQYLNSCLDSDGVPFSQSRRQYAMIANAFELFAEEDHASFRWNRNYQKALEKMKREMAQLHLKARRVVKDDDVRKILPKTCTHSGWAYILTGLRKKGDFLVPGVAQAYLIAEEEARRVGSFNFPILPGTRTQGSGAFDDFGNFTGSCKHKTRLISMICWILIVAECKYARPFQEYLGHQRYYAGGKSMDRISHIITDMRAKHSNYISLDYSRYDQTISSWLIEDAFSVIKAAFDDVDEELWQIIVNDFIHKNFITADGVVHSDKGVPSGSMFTQIIDSLVNKLMIDTYFNSIGAEADMIIMGDDNLMYFDANVNVEDLCSYLTKNFGIIANPDKSSHGNFREHPVFLSRQWCPGGQWRHQNVLISKLLFPERFRVYTGSVTPELVVYSYILAYRYHLERWFKVEEFLEKYKLKGKNVREVLVSEGSGLMKYLIEYEHAI